MTAVDQAVRYQNYVCLPGHDNPFGIRAGRRAHRWDGLMLDTIYHDAGINTVSFADSSTALAVLTQQGKVRKRHRAKPGDAVFLARENYVGIVIEAQSKTHLGVLVGWWQGDQGKRFVRHMALNREFDVLAVADPDLRVKTSPALRVLEPGDRKQIADVLSNHPAVDTFVAPVDFKRAYAQWQRYCGYGPDKATGEPDARSLERLGREHR
jgi:hypothetical protein